MYLHEMGQEADEIEKMTGGVDTTSKRWGIDTTKMTNDEFLKTIRNSGMKNVEFCS